VIGGVGEEANVLIAPGRTRSVLGVLGMGEGDELAQAVIAQWGGEVVGEPVEHDPALFAGADQAGCAE